MKITITGQLFIKHMSDSGKMDVTIGQSTSDVEFNFPCKGEDAMLRIDRRDLVKVLEILNQGLM